MRGVYVGLIAFIFLVLAGLFLYRASEVKAYENGKGAMPIIDMHPKYEDVYEHTLKRMREMPPPPAQPDTIVVEEQ